MFRDSGSSRTTLSDTPIQVHYQKPHTAVLVSLKVWKLTRSLSSRDRSALTADRSPSAVDSPTINFSLFSWTVSPPGQDASHPVLGRPELPAA